MFFSSCDKRELCRSDPPRRADGPRPTRDREGRGRGGRRARRGADGPPRGGPEAWTEAERCEVYTLTEHARIHSIETFMPPRTMHSHTCTALLIRGEARCLSKRASQGSCALCGELSALAHLDESLPLFGISLLVTSHVAGWSITWPSCHLPLALRLACTPRLPIPSGFSGRGP